MWGRGSGGGSRIPTTNTLAVEPEPGKWGQEFTQNKGDPGYTSVVAVNTGRGALSWWLVLLVGLQ